MTSQDSLDYAISRVGIAQIARDEVEVARWQDHVEYWRSLIAHESAAILPVDKSTNPVVES